MRNLQKRERRVVPEQSHREGLELGVYQDPQGCQLVQPREEVHRERG